MTYDLSETHHGSGERRDPNQTTDLRIVVVGPCASGKSTLVAGLRSAGYRAEVSGQEHSDVASLWNHGEPDLVVALDVDLETIRRRRGNEAWPRWLYERQQHRLAEARDRADLRVDTSRDGARSVLDRVISWLDGLADGERLSDRTN